MHIKDLAGKSVCILGFGREGQAMLRAIEKHAPTAKVTICDQNQNIQDYNLAPSTYNLQLGKDCLNNLNSFDIIIKSPGVYPRKELEAVNEKVTNSVQIFLDTIKEKGSTVIGVTGSKGKSTTSSLIFAILKDAGKETRLIGNIGEPVMDHLEEATSNTIFVQEMSSYQLMNLKSSPHIAVITSFFPEHLDYHGSLEGYKDAKKNIARFQTKNDIVIYPETSEGAKEIAMESKGEKISCTEKDAAINIKETHLLGEHNLSNIAVAIAVAKKLGIPTDVYTKTIKEFKGLPHRLESLGVHHEIEWIDDAISTTPESTIAALNALGDSVTTLILGGMDRGSDFTPLVDRLKKSKVETILLLGTNSELLQMQFPDSIVCTSMEEVIRLAKEKTKKGTICLLSPAAASYGMFKNFEEKGDMFKTEILKD